MKLTIERDAFFDGLSHVQSVVERRNTIPILSNTHIQAEQDHVRLTATDLDIEVIDKAPAHIETEGTITAPASTLFDIVRKLPSGGDISMELDSNNQLVLKAGRSRFVLPTLAASDFQIMPTDEDATRFDITAANLRHLIDKTRFAISTEETRYYLNGVYLHAALHDSRKTLRAVSTDGHRLALSEIDAPPSLDDAFEGVIIPRKAIVEIRRLLEGIENEALVSVAVSSTKIMVRAGKAQLTSKLIDGTFPDYARVIPENNTRVLIIDNKRFETAVDRVATISAERARSVKLSLDDNKLVLTVNSAETGQGYEEIECDYQKEELSIGFNAKYLLDITPQIEAKNIHFLFNDTNTPALILDPDDNSTQYVLMPLRV